MSDAVGNLLLFFELKPVFFFGQPPAWASGQKRKQSAEKRPYFDNSEPRLRRGGVFAVSIVVVPRGGAVNGLSRIREKKS